jgi:hypothetical protein
MSGDDTTGFGVQAAGFTCLFAIYSYFRTKVVISTRAIGTTFHGPSESIAFPKAFFPNRRLRGL